MRVAPILPFGIVQHVQRAPVVSPGAFELSLSPSNGGLLLTDCESPPNTGSPCVVCGEPALDVVVASGEHRSRSKLWRYTLLQCRACGHGHLLPSPSDDVLTELYAGYYPEDEGKNGGLSGEGSFVQLAKAAVGRLGGVSRGSNPGAAAARVLTRVIEGLTARSIPLSTSVPLALPRGSRILDFGCGAGGWLLAMKRVGYRDLWGLELAYEHLKDLKANGIRIVQSVEELPEGALDCVRVHHVLEHLRDPLQTLRVLHAALRPGGSLLIGVPNFGSQSAQLLRDRWSALLLPFHLNHFTERSLALLLARAGFETREFQLRPVWDHTAPAILRGDPSPLAREIWKRAYYQWARSTRSGDFLDAWAARV
jgi:SAM-dependent methyltransferase